MLSIERDPKRGGYLLRAECQVPRPIEEVFAFFSDATQLETLTPPWLNFRVLTPQPIEMREGLLIDYRLRIRFIPMRWQSEITAWEPTGRFVDEQRRGPYKYWHHEHLFESAGNGTRVVDVVQYGVPGGGLVHALAVRCDVARIFAYRQQQLREIFG